MISSIRKDRKSMPQISTENEDTSRDNSRRNSGNEDDPTSNIDPNQLLGGIKRQATIKEEDEEDERYNSEGSVASART
jgi:hypothetical protein